MGKFSGYLLASDADGTLLGRDTKICERNIENIKRFTNNGGKFIVATGRTADGARFMVEATDVNAPCIVANGAQIYDFEKEEIVWEMRLSDEELEAAQSVFLSGKFEHCGTELHSGSKVYVFSPTEETNIHQVAEELDAVICNDDEIGNIKGVFKALISMRSAEEFDAIEQFIRANAKCPLKIIHSTATLMGSKYDYLEILPFGASKAVALKELQRLEGEKIKKTIAIGDYYNDKEMLEFADISAVPSGAPLDLKEMADYVVCDCSVGAVGHLIEQLENRKDEI